MIIHAQGGTDGASMVLFWPANLPDNADEILEDDPSELIEQQAAASKLIAFPCDSDGMYRVSIYVRTSIPENTLSSYQKAETVPALVVSGDGYFGGAEYMFKRNAAFLRQYAFMMEKVEIPNGTYNAAVYTMNAQDGLKDAWISERAGKGAKRARDIQGVFSVLGCLSVIATVFGFFIWGFTKGMYVICATVAMALVPILIGESKSGKKAAQAARDFDIDFPKYLVALD